MKKIIRLTESELISLVKKVINESDPKVGTGKKPEGSDRRLYTDENPSDTVSVKFKTKQDIVDTLNKESFKSKSHARQSQIINLIHQRLRVALERAKDPEVKKRLRTAFEYIESKKEASKRKTKGMKEGLHDTSWQNDEGDKVTLMDLLNATEDIPVERFSVEELKPHLLSWDGDKEEIAKIEKADLQYPILIFVDDNNRFISIIDGHHRAQKAARNNLKTIKAKIIPINSLPKDIRKVFSHMGKQEEIKEGELTEKYWAGYTQKGMKTMISIINENDELTNRILDKINTYGIDSLSGAERKYLDNKSQDIEDDEVSDIASIDSGYEFDDTVDGYDVKFIYDETEEWDDDPVEFKHTGEFFIDGEKYYATMYTDEDLNVHSFDLHNGDDYEEFDDELEESLFEFFQQVGDKIKQSMI
jgi:hypothetical protein